VRCCPRCTHPASATDCFCLHCGQFLAPARRRRWLVGGLLLLLCLAGARAGVAAGVLAGAAPCHFVLGFQTLHGLMPARVGACLDDERYLATSGETIQHTSGGLLVWRKADNGTAFTDGSQTWVLGPHGLQERPNNRRFAWEANQGRLLVIR
jgi:hypothetical protein